MKDYIVAIDPGTTESGVCIIQTSNMKPVAHIKVDNDELFSWVVSFFNSLEKPFKLCSMEVVIERIQGNNMPVGSDVFLTCEWIGRFAEKFNAEYKLVHYIFRRDEYRTLCSNIYTHNDKGIRSSLVDRFAYGEKNYGKGTKNNPGWFYGFSEDVWQAYAIGVTYIDKYAIEGV